MIDTATCYLLVCDGCHCASVDCDGVEIHYDTVEKAREVAAEFDEWTRTEDGRDLCQQCTNRELCASEGHLAPETEQRFRTRLAGLSLVGADALGAQPAVVSELVEVAYCPRCDKEIEP